MPAALLAAVVVLCLAPLAAAVTELVADPAALAEVLFSARVGGLLLGTLALGLVTALCCCLVGVPVGRLLARRRGWPTVVLAALLPLPLVLPPWMAGVAWTAWLPLQGFWGAVFLLTVSLWPLVALFALRGFRQAGRAGDAAALATGRPLAVELPIALPSILSGALLCFVFTVTDFAVVDFLSFQDPEPFVVLSSEIFQKWARLESGGEAAAVSVAAIVPSLLALAGVLALERGGRGRHRGQARLEGRVQPLGLWRGLVLLALLATMVEPLAVLGSWAVGADDAGEVLASARDALLFSTGTALAVGALIAGLGLALARLSLRLGPRGEAWLLAALLAPLAAPGVMFAVGQIRLWNAPWNPLADLVYPAPALLILSITGRYLCLGVLAARTLLLRLDEGPLRAARLAGQPAWRRVLVVSGPLLAPATGLAAALGYLLALRELDMIVLVPAGSATLAHRIFSLVHIASDDVTAVLCVALIALVIVPAAAARLLGLPGVDCGSPARDP